MTKHDNKNKVAVTITDGSKLDKEFDFVKHFGYDKYAQLMETLPDDITHIEDEFNCLKEGFKTGETKSLEARIKNL
jgi:aldehyde dehydrogenase (NAD+)